MTRSTIYSLPKVPIDGKVGVMDETRDTDKIGGINGDRETPRDVGGAAIALSDNGVDGEESPLVTAARRGEKGSVESLLIGQADEAEVARSLRVAAACGHEEIVNTILSSRTQFSLINSKDESGYTALHFAALANRKNVAELLLSKCPELAGVANCDGQTALHIATRTNACEVVRLLASEKYSALKVARDRDGRTAMDIARSRNLTFILELLGDSPASAAIKPDAVKEFACRI